MSRLSSKLTEIGPPPISTIKGSLTFADKSFHFPSARSSTTLSFVLFGSFAAQLVYVTSSSVTHLHTRDSS